MMPIPHPRIFPGAVIADRALIDMSPQSWISALWIDGFALLSLDLGGLRGPLR
jgi:hypothetical protein